MMLKLISPLLLSLALVPVPVLADPPHGGGLPPGLQKKLERGEPLPPPFQARQGDRHYKRGDRDRRDHRDYRRGDYLDSRYLDYDRVYDLDRNRQRVEVEDRVYTIIKDTREIVDILKGQR
ncbi:hypothetical protein [Marinobacter shengliensis]